MKMQNKKLLELHYSEKYIALGSFHNVLLKPCYFWRKCTLMLTFSHLYKHVLGLRKLQFASLLACAGVVESGVVTVWFFFSDNSWDFSVFLLRWYYSCGLMVFKKLCWFPTMYQTHTHTPMLHLAKKWHLSCYKFGSSWVHFQDHLLLLYALFWCFDNLGNSCS